MPGQTKALAIFRAEGGQALPFGDPPTKDSFYRMLREEPNSRAN